MMKYLMVGVWAVLAALGGAYGGHAYVTRPPPPATWMKASIPRLLMMIFLFKDGFR